MGSAASSAAGTTTPTYWVSLKGKGSAKAGGYERVRGVFALSAEGAAVGGARAAPRPPAATVSANSRGSEGETLAEAALGPVPRERVLRTQDQGMGPQHVQVRLVPGAAPGGPPLLAFTCAGRAYFQLPSAGGPFPLAVGHTLKLGACSLQVDYISAGGHASTASTTSRALAVAAAAARVAPIPLSSLTDPCCYICLEGEGEAGSDPLTNSMCQCAKPVHPSCLHRWVTARRSRDCSICKSAIPLSWLKCIIQPPFAVLRVVRHVRGLRWGSQREFIIVS
jgi:hypothetical protein